MIPISNYSSSKLLNSKNIPKKFFQEFFSWFKPNISILPNKEKRDLNEVLKLDLWFLQILYRACMFYV